MLRRLAWLAACLPAVLSVGCEYVARRPSVWAVDDMVRLTERTTDAEGDGVWRPEARTIDLFAAANETVSFQLVVDAPPEGLSGLRLSVDPSAGPKGQGLPAGAVTLYRMRPVKVGRYPAWWLRLTDRPPAASYVFDVLAPMGSRPLTLKPDERLAVWVDVDVPRDCLADTYHAKLALRHAGGTETLKIALTVYDFLLPDIRPVPCLAGFSHKDVFRQFLTTVGPDGRPAPFEPAWMDRKDPKVRTGLVLVRQLMRLAHRHRLDLVDRDLRPVLKRDAAGGVRLVWDDYDAVVKPYLDGSAFTDGLGVFAWPAPLWTGWPGPRDYGGVLTARYRKTVADVAAATAEHYEALGFAEKLFFWPRTGPAGPAAYARHVALARLVRPAAPKTAILSDLPPTPPPASTWAVPKDFAALTEMYAPPAGLAPLSAAVQMRRLGRPMAGVYLRPGDAPYVGSCGRFATPADVRALPWIAMKHRCAGIFLPEALNWSAGADRGGEGRLFHPDGPAGPKALDEDSARERPLVLASVRLKWLRRGLQDAAYLWLLRQRGRGAVADAMIAAMVHYAGLDAAGDHYQDVRLDGWVRRGRSWRRARRLLAEEIRSVIHPDAVTAEDLLAQRVAWKKLQQGACRVRVERVRSRFEMLPGGRYRAAVAVEIYNELPQPVDVTLAMGLLPPGWRAETTAAKVPKMPPGKRLTIELSAAGDHVRTGGAARMPVPLILTSELRQPLHWLAEVPFLPAGYTDRKIDVDGNFDDWPMRIGNRAADFRLIGRRGLPGAPADAARARRATSVHALHDGRTLYLAFRCDDPKPDAAVAAATNAVRYQQLLAGGEDLLEVIADPGRAAAGPEGLYHLVIKSSGVLIAERGVGCTPPLGRVSPWAAGAKVAVGKCKGFWTVEAAVPLSAFGDAAGATTWGVNFARFATARAAQAGADREEASNWAGAARYYYHPKDLGTMVLVPKGARVDFEPQSDRSGE